MAFIAMKEKKLNKIGDVHRDQGRTNKWLAGRLGMNHVTVSRWVRNVQQPGLETLYRIAQLLGVPVCDLLVEDYEAEDEANKN